MSSSPDPTAQLLLWIQPSLPSVTHNSGEDATYHFNKDSRASEDITILELASQEIH